MYIIQRFNSLYIHVCVYLQKKKKSALDTWRVEDDVNQGIPKFYCLQTAACRNNGQFINYYCIAKDSCTISIYDRTQMKVSSDCRLECKIAALVVSRVNDGYQQ